MIETATIDMITEKLERCKQEIFCRYDVAFHPQAVHGMTHHKYAHLHEKKDRQVPCKETGFFLHGAVYFISNILNTTLRKEG